MKFSIKLSELYVQLMCIIYLSTFGIDFLSDIFHINRFLEIDLEIFNK